MNSQLLAILYGLASAASWGAGDFCGGVATRRSNAVVVVAIAHVMGGGLLMALALLLRESMPPLSVLLLGATGGFFGGVGVLALYRGLASGRMGVVAPISAVVTAILPVIVGAFTEGLPSLFQMAGFGIALVAVWLLSGGGPGLSVRTDELRWALIAGLGFGLFFIFVDQAVDAAVLWPLVAARAASTALAAGILLLGRQATPPGRIPIGMILLSGISDAGGNGFFALATRAGRLDISAVVSSLFPAGTVLLAWLFLKERLDRRQWVGVAAALAALVLIAI
jgi:drug/metabolite transporter (DMT)-like permease